MKNKKVIRSQFRNSVLMRDKYTCQICGIKDTPMDAHHITDRNEMINGGYVIENGITLCQESCHMKAEQFHISGGKEWIEGFHPNDLYKLIKSSYELAVKKSCEL